MLQLPRWLLLALALSACAGPSSTQDSTEPPTNKATKADKSAVGELLFFDEDLSEPAGRSCASCHHPAAGFADPNSALPTSQGSVSGRFGRRNSPTIAYTVYSSALYRDEVTSDYLGGLFWDGRASTLQAQAKLPFLSPLEMNNVDAASVVTKVQKAAYAEQFRAVYGADIFGNSVNAYDAVADALAHYEAGAEVNRFSSKFDAVRAAKAVFSAAEQRGLEVFAAEDKGNCASCHPHEADKAWVPPILTDFGYDNLGVPANPANRFYSMPPDLNPAGADFVDKGLGGFVQNPAEEGKFKVPTLRNIGLTAPYMHNGVFATLSEVLDFYNSRDVGKWPAAEVNVNVNAEDLGDLGLSEGELGDLEAFLLTLSDGWGE